MEPIDKDFPPVHPLSAYPNRIPLSGIPLTKKGRLTAPDTAVTATIDRIHSASSTRLICLLYQGAMLCIHNTVASWPQEESLLELLFPSARIAIKDGLITGKRIKGKPVIHVACPASIEFISPTPEEDESTSPPFQKVLADCSNDRSQAWKSLGKTLISAQRYVLAGVCLDAASLPGDADVHVSRAWCYYMVERFQDAVRCCDRALAIDECPGGALHAKGVALGRLQRHGEAVVLLETALASPSPDVDKDQVQRDLDTACELRKQQQRGEYDVSDYFLNWKAPLCSDFTSAAVEIRMTGDGRGRGVFLSKDVKVGELLMVSNPVVSSNELETLQVLSIRSCCNSSHVRKLLSLLPDPESGDTLLAVPSVQDFEYSVEEEEDDGVIDVRKIKRVVELASRVSLTTTVSSKQLFTLPYFINHSCTPNSSTVAVGEALFVRAAKALQAGDEITVSYTDCLQPQECRSRSLSTKWGFDCCCERCEVEKRYKDVLGDVPHILLRPGMNPVVAVNAAVNTIRKLELGLGKLNAVITDDERGMVRVGYAECYMAIASKLVEFDTLTKLEVMDLLRTYVLGYGKSVALIARVVLGYVLNFVWEDSFDQTFGDAMAALMGSDVDLPSGDYILICDHLKNAICLFDED